MAGPDRVDTLGPCASESCTVSAATTDERQASMNKADMNPAFAQFMNDIAFSPGTTLSHLAEAGRSAKHWRSRHADGVACKSSGLPGAMDGTVVCLAGDREHR